MPTIRNALPVKLVYFVLFLNMVFDSFLFYFQDRTVWISLQFLFNFTLFGWFFATYRNVIVPRVVLAVFPLVIYLVVMGIFSSDLELTYNYILKFSIPIGYFILGWNMLSNKDSVKILVSMLWIGLAYFVVYMIVCNLADIGEPLYKGGIKTGYFAVNGIYFPAISAFIVLFLGHYSSSRVSGILNLVLAVATVIALGFILKRIILVMLTIGIVAYLMSNFSIKRLALILLLSIIGGAALWGFRETLNKSIKSRESRFSESYSVLNEGRFTENTYIYDIMNEHPIQLILGTGEVFNDRSFLSALNVYGADRQAHNSFIRVFWSAGILGLVAFLYFYFFQFRDVWAAHRLASKVMDSSSGFRKHLLDLAIALIIARFVNEISSGVTYLTYNSLCFFVIGAALHQGYALRMKAYIEHAKRSTQDFSELPVTP